MVQDIHNLDISQVRIKTLINLNEVLNAPF